MAGDAGFKLGKLNGRHVVTWYEQGKRHRHRLAAGISREAAHSELARIVRQREKLLSKEVETVEDIMAAYIRDRELDSKSTAKQEHSWKALRPEFGHLKPDEIDKQACRHYVKLRESKGRSVGTAWTELSVLRAALNWAAKEKKIGRAPFIFLPTPPKPLDRHLTREEANRLHRCAVGAHIKLFIQLALATGGRASALLELEWDRVDFDRGMIDLRTAEQNKKRRAVVPMNEGLRTALLEAELGALTPYVIEWGAQRVRSVKKGFGRAVQRAGLEDVTPHTLRHTAAVWMAEAGVPMSEISQFLGHSSTKVTERVYARYSPEYLRHASRSLELSTANLLIEEKGVLLGSSNRVERGRARTQPRRAD